MRSTTVAYGLAGLTTVLLLVSLVVRHQRRWLLLAFVIMGSTMTLAAVLFSIRLDSLAEEPRGVLAATVSPSGTSVWLVDGCEP